MIGRSAKSELGNAGFQNLAAETFRDRAPTLDRSSTTERETLFAIGVAQEGPPSPLRPIRAALVMCPVRRQFRANRLVVAVACSPGLARAAAHEHWLYALCVIAWRLNGRDRPKRIGRRRLIARCAWGP